MRNEPAVVEDGEDEDLTVSPFWVITVPEASSLGRQLFSRSLEEEPLLEPASFRTLPEAKALELVVARA